MMDDIRAEFESWYTKEFGYPFNLTVRDGQYMNSDANSMWIAWQAATEAARGGVDPVMYVNEGQIKAARKMRSRGKDVGYVAFSLPNEGFNSVPLYTHPPAPVAPEGHGETESLMQDALGDIQYMAGLKAGFSLGDAGDNDGLASALKARSDAVGVAKTASAMLNAAPGSDQ